MVIMNDILNTCQLLQLYKLHSELLPLHKSNYHLLLVARLTRDRWIPISREFELHQRPPLFP